MKKKQHRYKVTILFKNNDKEIYYVPAADPDEAVGVFEDDAFNIKKIISVERVEDEE